MPHGPLRKRYPVDAALVVCSLVPYLVLTAAVIPLGKQISQSLGLSTQTLDITVAMSTAAYAIGTVLAVQLAVHLPARRLLVVYEVLLVVASILAAWAPTGGVFVAAFIGQGLATSLLLIAAVPPLVTQWPAARMPLTGGIMNLCIFGAVAAGPTIGAFQATGSSWRPLFWGVAAVSVVALLLSVLSFEDQPPVAPDAPWDLVAVAMTVVGTGSAFFGAGRLQGSENAGAGSLLPLIAGFAIIVALVSYEARSKRPLMPVRAAATSVPVTGIYVALMASAASFGIMELVLQSLQKSSSLSHTGLLFLPEFGGAIVLAVVFGTLFKTRFTPVLAISGTLAIVASAALLLVVLPGNGPVIAAAAGVLGLGVAASVSPGLFLAGLSLKSSQLQPVFAMIELLRAVTAFLVAPILIYLSTFLGADQNEGTAISLWICLGIAAAGFLGGVLLYVTGRGRLVAPDLETWQGEGQPAWPSPPLFDRLRTKPAEADSQPAPERAGAGRTGR